MATAEVESIPVPVSQTAATEEAPAIQVTETKDDATPVEEPAAPEKVVADEPAEEVSTEKSADETAVAVVVEPAIVEETHEAAVLVTEVPAVVEPAAVEETQEEAVDEVVPIEKTAEETAEQAAVEETQEEATIEQADEGEPEAPAKADDSATAVEAVEVQAEKTEE